MAVSPDPARAAEAHAPAPVALHETVALGGSLVELTGVSRHFRVGATVVKALDEVDLTVREGEWVVVLGPSGSGKTTLLNMISALDSPTAGRAVIAGQDITRASRSELFRFRRHTVSFIFQTFNLFPGLTALENVQFGADVAGRERSREVAVETLGRVGLADRLQHFPHELSGGEQQRVAIARAVASGNPLLVADEPTGELDFATGIEILKLLHEQHHIPGRAVITVTHNREISRVADRVIEMGSGRIVRDGPPEGGSVEIDALRW
jgi:putative ABC transport system ATP-binding protein